MNMKDKTFYLSGRGPYCGHWENEDPRFGTGMNNACDLCREQNGPCHVAKSVKQQGGIVELG
jgi:hypothetical protein